MTKAEERSQSALSFILSFRRMQIRRYGRRYLLVRFIRELTCERGERICQGADDDE
jgi:hypothetical protein